MTSKKQKNNITFELIFLFLIILSLSLITAQYFRSSTQYTSPGVSSFAYGGGSASTNYYSPILSKEECGMAGQDFILQIDPMGCTPSVIRSDLLEEQNVPVFCPIVATKINPLIDVEAIKQMSFKGQYPPEVAGVGFHPARAAVSGYSTFLGSSVLSNIGYAVIVLRQQENESAMPDFVEGNLTADIRYDIKNAFGTGQAEFYLPEMDESEWQENYMKYVFWNGNGFLRADSIDSDSAMISIYRDKDILVSNVNLKKGTTSRKVYLPGYYCLAGLQLKLESVEAADTRAKLRINVDVKEAKINEKFLDNKCIVRKIEKQGLAQKVEIRCQGDEGRSETFTLEILPKIELEINGITNKYSVGDKLFEGDAGKSVYLVYAETIKQSKKSNGLSIYVLETSGNNEKLSSTKISSISKSIKLLSGSKKDITLTNEVLYKIDAEDAKDVFGKKIKIIGFTATTDKKFFENELNDDANKFETYFDSAIKDYETLVQEFPNEKRDINLDVSEKFSEIGLQQAIELADKTEQKQTRNKLIEKFIKEFPDSSYTPIAQDILSNEYMNSNSETASKDIYIDNQLRTIFFEGIYEPTYEEYGVEIVLRGDVDNQGISYLGKNERIYLDNSRDKYIELKEIKGDDLAVFLTNADKEGSTIQVKLDKSASIEDKKNKKSYEIFVTDINVKRVAYVKVIPSIDYSGTQADFNFKIGIEKRAFDLAPDKIQERIDKLNETIEKWQDISDGLGKVVKGLKGACFATGAILSVKNLISNAGGKSISRGMIMNTDGGWKDYCKEQVAQKAYQSMDHCFTKNADKIDRDNNALYKNLQEQNEQIKKLQEPFEQTTSGEKIIDTDKFANAYLNEDYKNTISNGLGDEITIGKQKIKTSDAVQSLTSDSYDKGVLTISDARELELLTKASNNQEISPELRKAFKKSAQLKLGEIYMGSKETVELKSLSDEYNVQFRSYGDKKSIKGIYDGDVNSNGEPVQGVIYQGSKYIFKLGLIKDNDYSVEEVQNLNGQPLDEKEQDKIKKEFSKFTKYDRTSYENKYIEPLAHYYETEPYKGLPAIVPFDLKRGWYAATRQTLPGFGGIASYEESGRVSSFYLCNVGKNGREQFNSGIGDDICQMINLATGQPLDQFPGLEKTEATKLIRSGVQAIEQASKQYKSGVQTIKISTAYGSYTVKVGVPETNVPEIQCQDFMSPKDCNLLFNVCDPVICPSSRCNLGGTYHVRDVVQSGIVGSIALCLPNFKEGIAVPVCLTGIKAGIDGLLSVFTAYRDCLQENLDTGKTVGVCDEIHSIYLCEFFWRQAVPFAKMIIPKILDTIGGKGIRGGGEYLGLASSWKNTENSINWFTQNYALNSFKAFKARDAESAGSEVCKNFISIAGSDTGDFLDTLLEPDSPSQFHGWFHEIPFTSATVPPISQYKVFYHIFSGKDRGAYYRVYLRSPVGSSFYQDNPTVLVAGGYIAKGEYADETKDFTAPSGYKELCISVNAQEECGFKQVSTSFALDYIEDKYLEEQASKTDIVSEKECISGSPSLYSMVTPNIQEGVNDVINPELYNKGITRICSTDNPGLNTDAKAGTNESRWVEVGYCDNKKIKCWLDTQSVKRNIDITTIEEGVLSEVNKHYQELLGIEGKYLEDVQKEIEDFEKQLGGVKDEIALIRIASEITKIYEKASWINQKANLLYLRAGTYNKLARIYYNKLKQSLPKKDEVETGIQDKLILTKEPGKIGTRVSDKYGDVWEKFEDGWWIIELNADGTKFVKSESGAFEWKDIQNPIVYEFEESEVDSDEIKISYPQIVRATTKEISIDVSFCEQQDYGYREMRIDLYKDNFWIFDNELDSKTFDEEDVVDGEIIIETPSKIDKEDKVRADVKCGDEKSVETKSVVIEGEKPEKLEQDEQEETSYVIKIKEGVYETRYGKYKSIFELYSKKNKPSNMNEIDFKSLLSAIATAETSMGENNPKNLLMGYGDSENFEEYRIYQGAEKQISGASAELKFAFENDNGLYDGCYSVSGNDKIKCILEVYNQGEINTEKGRQYSEQGFNYYLQWKEYFENN